MTRAFSLISPIPKADVLAHKRQWPAYLDSSSAPETVSVILGSKHNSEFSTKEAIKSVKSLVGGQTIALLSVLVTVVNNNKAIEKVNSIVSISAGCKFYRLFMQYLLLFSACIKCGLFYILFDDIILEKN